MRNFCICCLAFYCAIPQFASAQNTGVGTPTPKAKLHVGALASDSIALKVSVNGINKLKVHSNGGTTIGSDVAPAINGLTVQGIFQPNDSIKNANRPIYITSVQDSLVLKAGNTSIILSANGNVRIIASGGGDIIIDAGAGDVSIKGMSVNIQATGNATLNGLNTTVSSQNMSRLQGPLVLIGNGSSGFRPAARLSDTIQVTGGVGTINSGSPTVFIQ